MGWRNVSESFRYIEENAESEYIFLIINNRTV